MSNAKFSVIVVEDEKLIARNISRSIHRVNKHFEVVALATNGEEALSLIDDMLPNVVFTDIRMPVMDGLKLCKKINEEYSYIICVILSGYNEFSYAKEAIHNNVMDYLLKPVNEDELSQILGEIEKKLVASQESFEIDDDPLYQKPDKIVELIEEFIHEHYMDLLDLGEIADKFGFSISYLSKIFAKITGRTPTKYIRDHRINIAKQLLRNPNLSIAVIGRKVGYPDQFHFSKVFKQTTGFSPSEFRTIDDTKDIT